jgi:dsRNA-specific ribonuclease
MDLSQEQIMDREEQERREREKQEREKEMLTPILGVRDDSFRQIIKYILVDKGKIKDHYVDLLLDDEGNFKLFSNAFTSVSISSYRDTESSSIKEDKNSPDNYDLHRKIGEGIYANFIVSYIISKLNLKTASEVKNVARIRINYESKITFPSIVERFDLEPYISASKYELKEIKKKIIFEHIFLSFIGTTSMIFDNATTIGVGYSTSYNILSSIFNEMFEIKRPSKFEELDNPITTLKNFFDRNHHRLGYLLYKDYFDKKTFTNSSKIYRVIRGYEPQKNEGGEQLEIGSGESFRGEGSKPKKIAQRKAAISSLDWLTDNGYSLDFIKRKKDDFHPDKKIIINGIRRNEFSDFIKNIFIRSDIDEKYINILLNEESLKIYNNAFTSNTANLDRSLLQDEDSSENYEIYETIGDSVFANFIYTYSLNRFSFKTPNDVKSMSKIKSKYGSKNEFSSLSKKLGFLPFITASKYELQKNEIDILEDVFESFIGSTCFILDNNIRRGTGYNICYRILCSIYNQIDIPIEFEKLNDDITVLKEIFDPLDEELVYEYDKVGVNKICYIYSILEDGPKHLLGKGIGNDNDEAKLNASRDVLKNLKK